MSIIWSERDDYFQATFSIAVGADVKIDLRMKPNHHSQ